MFRKDNLKNELRQETVAPNRPTPAGGGIFDPSGDVRLPRDQGSPSRLSSNICIQDGKSEAIMDLASAVLSPYYKRSAQTLYSNVMRLTQESKSIGHLAFITITFKRNVQDHLEASRCWKSANSNWFSPNPDYGTYINTKELQEKRRMVWHYHIIAEVGEDIREGFDFDLFAWWLKGNNRFKHPCPTGSPYFHRLWKELNEVMPSYGFGYINSIEPIRTTEEAVSRYIGGYIGKTIGRRSEQEKGVRLVNYPKGWLRNSPKFSWNTSNAAEWRRKVSKFANIHGCSEFYQISQRLGPNWAYKYLEDIVNVDLNHLESKVEDFVYQEDGSRISRHTGQIRTAQEIAYQDTIFKAIQNNQKQKRERLKAEAAGTIDWRLTENQISKSRKEKEQRMYLVEQCKNQIRNTKLEKPPKPTPEEQEEREFNAIIRNETRAIRREREKYQIHKLGITENKEKKKDARTPQHLPDVQHQRSQDRL